MATPHVTMTDSNDEQTHSNSNVETIIGLVMSFDMPKCSARRLTQLHCNGWPVWDAYNVKQIAKARRLDDTRDWYFPIIVPAVPARSEENLGGEVCKRLWSLSGIWHSEAHHATKTLLPLPSMAILPPDWLYYSLPLEDIIASPGGLLLIKGVEGTVPFRRSHRLNPCLAESISSSYADVSAVHSNLPGCPSWKRLLVCNPLTKKCKELPTANCQPMGLESWSIVYSEGAEVMMDVDEMAKNYRVILTLASFVAVYTSTTNTWQCLSFQHDCPWDRRLRMGRDEGYHWASALFGKHLYFANVEQITENDVGMDPIDGPTPAATLRLFEVDTEAGRWKRVQEYTLRKFHILHADHWEEELLFCMRVNPFIELVECRGALYAVIPAKLHDVLLIKSRPRNDWSREVYNCGRAYTSELDFMPLCFYIIRLLQEDGVVNGVDHGVLRIKVRRTRFDFNDRNTVLKCLASNCCRFEDTWFSCNAQGSVIWVSCKDYLLSYDLVSHESTTQIMPVNLWTQDSLRFSYRPNFYMQP